MSKKKIILIHHLAARENARPNQIAKYLAKMDIEVHLILWDVPYPIKLFRKNLFNSLKYKRYKVDGEVVVHKIRRLPFFCPFINKWLFHRQIRDIFKKEKIDVIISESYINEMDPPAELPMIFSLVDDFESYAEFYGSTLYKLVFRILEVRKTIENQIKRAKSVIVVSDLLKKYANQYNDKVFKITNGVESWVLEKKYKKNKYDFGRHSLIYVSGFDYWSNLPDALYALSEVKKNIPDIKLILVGDGSQIPEGKILTKQLNLEDNVMFFGPLADRVKLFEIVNACEICLNLSEKNKRGDAASPIKVFEYTALGKIIISTRLREVEVLNFPNIIYYQDKSKKSLVDAINKSFTVKADEKKIKKLAIDYTWENIAKKFAEVIDSTIKDLN
ncbi:MAG TPA: glycosyltransferase family 4 protein [Patescibacteria group bacterium]|nr:glycosyltransferase family 4 protein [Patescibacteria group bacterium]